MIILYSGCFDDVAQPKKGLISTQKSWQIMKDEDEADLFDPATMSANRAKFKQKQQEHRWVHNYSIHQDFIVRKFV